MNCVILAASRGERLEPFTTTRPKTLIPIANQPVLWHRIRACTETGIKHATVVTGYRSEMVQSSLEDEPISGTELATAQVAKDGTPFETVARIARQTGRDCLLLDGDIYSDPELLPDLLKSRSDAPVVALLAYDLNPLYHFRASQAKEKLDSLELVESLSRPQVPRDRKDEEMAQMYAGACLVRPPALGLLEEFGRESQSGSSIDFVKFCLSRGISVGTAISQSFFVNIDYPWELFAAKWLSEELFKKGKEEQIVADSAEISPGAQLRGRVIIGENVSVASGSVVENSMVGDGSRILENSYVVDAFLAKNCSIGPMGYVRNSTLGPESRVGTPSEAPALIGFKQFGLGHHCHAGTGVYGDGVALNAGAIVTAWRGEMVKMRIKGELISAGWGNMGVFMGDHSTLMANAIVMPGRKVGTEAVVGPGVLLYRDLPPYTRIVARQQTEEQLVYRPAPPKGGRRHEIKVVSSQERERVMRYLAEHPEGIDPACAAEELGLPEELVRAVMHKSQTDRQASRG